MTIDRQFQTSVKSKSRDSSFFDATGRIYELFGEAEVNYGDITLQADYIRLNYATNEVFARGRYDSTTRKWIGQPIFQDGADTYNTKEIRYNFKTKKGIISSVITAQGEGNIRGPRVKKDADNNVYIGRANGQTPIYTTCNLTTPHFHIAATKIKVVHNKQVVAGPFYLAVNEVPLPLGLPFGFFPIPKKKEIGTSGLIFPQYGEEPNGRGFFLRDGGYYWALNEYIGMQFKASIYSNGSWGAGVESQYLKRYRYGGQFALRYSRNRLNRIVEAQAPSNDFSIIWSHAPQNRGARSSFSANVNVASNSYSQLNATSLQQTIRNVAGSSVQYSRQFGQYVRSGANFRVNQNFGRFNQLTGLRENGQTDVSADVNLGVTQIAPFALRGGTGQWYESFRVGFDFNASAQINNVRRRIDTTGLGFPVILTSLANIRGDTIQARIDSLNRVRSGDFSQVGQNLYPFNLETLPELLRNMQVQSRYSIPISLPNFKIARYINFTPGISFQGDLYTKKLQFTRQSIPGTSDIAYRIDTVGGVFSTYSVSFNGSVNTRAYGTYFVRLGRVQAIRHTIAPSVSFSYLPDLSNSFSTAIEGFRNAAGEPLRTSNFRGFGGSGGASPGQQASISYSLVNQIEMKVRSRSDSAKSEFEKISLFDNISLSGGYNIFAPQFNFSPVNLSANTQILKKVNFNFAATFDPYAFEYLPRTTNVYIIEADGRIVQRGTKGDVVLTRTNKLALNSDLKQAPLHLQNLNFFISTSFNPKGANQNRARTVGQQVQGTTPAEQAQINDIRLNPEEYVDFTIPWNLNLSYNFSLNKFTPTQSTIIQTLQITGDFSLTPKWKVSINSGYDIVARAPSLTTVSINRDLHCWDMSFSWTPFSGNRYRANYFSFDLRARSSILQDLKLSRRSRGGLNVGTMF